MEEYSVCPYCGSDMVFALEQKPTAVANEVCVSESMCSLSNQSGSDVIVTSNQPYSSSASGGEEVSDTSEEGSVEIVVDKMMRIATMADYSVSPLNGSDFKTKSTGKSLSSHSSKSSSQASNKNSSAVRSTSSVRSISSSVPPYNYSYADFSQVSSYNTWV